MCPSLLQCLRNGRGQLVALRLSILRLSVLVLVGSFWIPATVDAQPTVVNPNQLEPIVLFPGIDESEVRSLYEIEQWDPNASVLLYLVNRMPSINIFEFWRIKSFGSLTVDGIAQLDKRLDSNRPPAIERFQTTGKIVRLTRQPLRARDKTTYSITGYYVMDVAHAQSKTQLRICTPRLPSLWKSNDPVGQRVGIDGLLVYDYQTPSQENRTAVIAAPRIRWIPDQSNTWVHPDQVWLAQNGVDLGLFDLVRRSTGEPLKASDMQSHFEMLKAVSGNSPPDDGAEKIDIIKAHQQAQSMTGRRMRVRGHLRRITTVEEIPAKYRNRYGIQKFYELDLFVPIEGRLRVKDHETGKDLVFDNQFPVTVRVATLPAELQNNKTPRTDVEIECFYFRMWGYYSASSRKKNILQRSPLLIGFEPVVLTPEPASQLNNLILGGMVSVFLLIVGLVAYAFVAKKRKPSLPDEPVKIKIDLES